ncbi:MAG: hypothetical protein ACM3ST_09205 [Bdellovibrio bacteriovorus]
MANIQNDHALREALDGLSGDQQRVLGSRFAQSVLRLAKDERVRRAIETGLREDSSPGEVEDAFRAAKAYATKTYTDCGKDTDWLAQADHFVAAAATAALTPDALVAERQNRAWKAAVQARMAVNCELIESDEVSDQSESDRQYAIANAYLG